MATFFAASRLASISGKLAPIFQLFRMRGWLLALWLVQAGTVLVFLSFAGALPLIKSEWQLSNSQADVIQAAPQAGYIIAVLVLS